MAWNHVREIDRGFADAWDAKCGWGGGVETQ